MPDSKIKTDNAQIRSVTYLGLYTNIILAVTKIINQGKMTKKQKRDEEILKHGFALVRNFGNGSNGGPVTLCKALRRIETKTHRLAEDICNGTKSMEDAAFDRWHDRTIKRISELLPKLPAMNFPPIYTLGEQWQRLIQRQSLSI